MMTARTMVYNVNVTYSVSQSLTQHDDGTDTGVQCKRYFLSKSATQSVTQHDNGTDTVVQCKRYLLSQSVSHTA